ncbi:MAG TPA: dihydropteroate synthase [bacterium]|nr:dihydropteroate synthase [bacterium]
MGIINCTPDSFYDGGKNHSLSAALLTAESMIASNVDIIDIGGESSRPGSIRIDAEEEIERTVPLIKALKNDFPNVRISIDTYKYDVVSAAIDAGADLINDIYAMRYDPKIADVVSKNKLPICLMHMKGTPENMQFKPVYEGNVIDEINSFFSERISFSLDKGILPECIILDPGVGFGKRYVDNLDILRDLESFNIHERPLLVGTSRKSFIGKALNQEAAERLEGSIAAAVICVLNKAAILRVHDVPETINAVRLAEAVIGGRESVSYD